jgi:hypothetical protein
MNPRLTLVAVFLLALAVVVPGVAMAKPKHPHKAPLVPKAGDYLGTEAVLGEEEAISGEVLKSGGKYSVLLHAEGPATCAAGNSMELTLNSAAAIKEGKFKGVVTVPLPSLYTEVTIKITGHFTSPTELVGVASSKTKAEPTQPTISECATGNIKFTLKKE